MFSSSAKCKATTLKGVPCKKLAVSGSPFCSIHDPSRSSARSSAKSSAKSKRKTPPLQGTVPTGAALHQYLTGNKNTDIAFLRSLENGKDLLNSCRTSAPIKKLCTGTPDLYVRYKKAIIMEKITNLKTNLKDKEYLVVQIYSNEKLGGQVGDYDVVTIVVRHTKGNQRDVLDKYLRKHFMLVKFLPNIGKKADVTVKVAIPIDARGNAIF